MPAYAHLGTRRGFTLVELLVVLAIIAVLTAILFPVFARARESGRQTACRSNLKQLSLALASYREDYDGTSVLSLRPKTTLDFVMPDGSPGPSLLWHHALNPYVKNFSIFRCPSMEPSEAAQPYNGQWTETLGYGINQAVGGVKDGQIRRPSDLVVLSDNRYFRVQPNTADGPQDELNETCGAGLMASPHNGQATVAFYDGHVKTVRADSLFQAGGWGPGAPCDAAHFNGKRENWDTAGP